jgi:hypothetical protein
MREYSITLSKKNMKLLLEHVFLGNLMLVRADDEENENDIFLNTILSIMKTYNIEEDIEYDEETGKYEVSGDLKDRLMETLTMYDQDCFWEELPKMLALRDLSEKMSMEQMEELGVDGLIKMHIAAAVPYEKEFEKNSLKNLRLRKK